MPQERICPICGDTYQVSPSSRNVTCGKSGCRTAHAGAIRRGKQRPNHGAAVSHERAHQRACVVCGTLFYCAPSATNMTCSPECRKARRVQINQARHNEWSEASRARLSERGQTDNLKLGTAAAQQSPLAGPFETNQMAKIWWVMRLSDRRQWRVRNLRKWCRDHADLFAPDPWENAAAGLRQVQSWLTHTAPRKVTRWKDWTLTQAAMTPDERGDVTPNVELPQSYQTRETPE